QQIELFQITSDAAANPIKLLKGILVWAWCVLEEPVAVLVEHRTRRLDLDECNALAGSQNNEVGLAGKCLAVPRDLNRMNDNPVFTIDHSFERREYLLLGDIRAFAR